MYAYAADPEASVPDGGFVEAARAALRRPAVADGPLDDLVVRAADWAAAEGKRFTGLLDAGHREGRPAGHEEVLVRRAVLGCAPLSLVSGAWLQWLSAPGDFEVPVVLRILALYADDVGAGHPHASRGSAFLELLRRLRLAEHAVPAARLTGDQRVPESAFVPARPAAGDEQAAGRVPRRAARRRPVPAHGRSAARADDGPAGPAGRVRLGRRGSVGAPAGRGAERPDRQCRALVDELVEAEGDRGRRRRAARLHRDAGALREWSEALYAELVAAGDPAFDMAELMRQISSREGAVYHHQFSWRASRSPAGSPSAAPTRARCWTPWPAASSSSRDGPPPARWCGAWSANAGRCSGCSPRRT
ncbi:hypothetical protein LT493_20655 [Streptomyces tricolor]|nr:hypothetical protein [Streptomyces tricolor]